MMTAAHVRWVSMGCVMRGLHLARHPVLPTWDMLTRLASAWWCRSFERNRRT